MNDLSSNTKRVLIIAALLATFSLGLYGFLFWGVKAKNEMASTLLSEAQSDIEQNEILRSIRTSFAEHEKDIAQLDSYFVARDGVADFIAVVEAESTRAGVKISIGAVSAEGDPNINDDFKEML